MPGHGSSRRHLDSDVRAIGLLGESARRRFEQSGQPKNQSAYATYNPAASSLPRAASWDRNLATTINSHFDANGVLFGSTNVASSSGKLFVEDMTPRTIDEVIVGTARRFGNRVSGRAYWRYRKGTHFWEDTNNNARIAFRTANTPSSVPAANYIDDLSQRLAEIGSGSTYTNTSDTSRFAEPAGSKRTNPHAQLDLKYIQNVRVGPHLRFQIDADLFNVFNGQTGYNVNPAAHAGPAFGVARNFFDPRRFQIAARVRF
jgi:hypothetical protein